VLGDAPEHELDDALGASDSAAKGAVRRGSQTLRRSSRTARMMAAATCSVGTSTIRRRRYAPGERRPGRAVGAFGLDGCQHVGRHGADLDRGDPHGEPAEVEGEGAA
jgi:hypothetical protein